MFYRVFLSPVLRSDLPEDQSGIISGIYNYTSHNPHLWMHCFKAVSMYRSVNEHNSQSDVSVIVYLMKFQPSLFHGHFKQNLNGFDLHL